ncbi:hypothetical protein RD792_015530 [Penstemon davidsonii]|uniref:Uncharacterized protein n=1 Tax=Penstemon davidsonii TaxID=160366 RepID=A0ABR0CHD3_9LAMI|nr:hypothetical protein RD792_015530 [Penstemon davidsonii]
MASFLLLARVIAATICVTLAASMAARLGPTPMAAFQICLQVWMTSSLLADGLAVAGQAILACSFAEKDYKKATAVAARVLQMGFVLGLGLAVLVGLGLEFGSGVFSKDKNVIYMISIGIPNGNKNRTMVFSQESFTAIDYLTMIPQITLKTRSSLTRTRSDLTHSLENLSTVPLTMERTDKIEELTTEVRNFTKDLEAKQVEWSNVVSKFENMLGSATAASQANTEASNIVNSSLMHLESKMAMLAESINTLANGIQSQAWTGPPKSSVDKGKGPAIHIGGSGSREETPYKQGNGQTNVLDKKGSTSKARRASGHLIGL